MAGIEFKAHVKGSPLIGSRNASSSIPGGKAEGEKWQRAKLLIFLDLCLWALLTVPFHCLPLISSFSVFQSWLSTSPLSAQLPILHTSKSFCGPFQVMV